MSITYYRNYYIKYELIAAKKGYRISYMYYLGVIILPYNYFNFYI